MTPGYNPWTPCRRHPLLVIYSSRLVSSASSRAQRASACSLAASDPLAIGESVVSSHNLLSGTDASMIPIDSDDMRLSRSSSVQVAEDIESGHSNLRSGGRKDKGKGKERGSGIRVKEEPAAVSLLTTEASSTTPNVGVPFLLRYTIASHNRRLMKTIVLLVDPLALWCTVMGAREHIIYGASIRLWRLKNCQREMRDGSALLVWADRCALLFLNMLSSPLKICHRKYPRNRRLV